MKNILYFTFIFSLMIFSNTSCNEANPMSGKIDSKMITNAEIDKKIVELMAKMTLEEKVGQMVQYSGFGELTGPGAKDNDFKINKIKAGLAG
jgi:beta-glucosidase